MLIFNLFSGLHAQEIHILDAITRNPVGSASVRMPGSDYLLYTDYKGRVAVDEVMGDTLMVSSIGYRQTTLPVTNLFQDSMVVLLQPDPVYLDPVNIGANRLSQQEANLPNKISRLHRQDVLFQQPQTSADLLGNTGEVFIQKSQQSGGSPMIRGFATNRVLITVDDIRMNSAIFRSGNLQNVISIDPLATNDVSVLFGPGSVIYGSDAIGGVMNFQTLTPLLSSSGTPLVKGNVLTRWSSANQEKTGHFDLSIGLRKWAFITSVSGNDFGDLKMGKRGPNEYLRPEYVVSDLDGDVIRPNDDPYKQVPSAYKQINLMQKVFFQPNDRWSFQYAFHYSNSSDNPRYDNLIRYRSDQLRWAEWYYGPQQWVMNHVKLIHRASTGIYDEMKINIAHQYFKESRHDRPFAEEEKNHNEERVNAYSLNVDFYKRLGVKHVINYGLESVYDKVGSTGALENMVTGLSEEGPTRYPDGSSWSSHAAFVTHEYQASNKMVLQSGLRYNYFIVDAEFNDTFYPFPFERADVNTGALTGSAGIVYTPGNKWRVQSNISTGFRAPNIDDIGKVFESTPGSVVVPNPGLSAEYATNVDLGFAKTFGEIFKVDATGFYTYLSNAMVRRDFSLNGQTEMEYAGELSTIQAIQNAANAKVYGVSAGVQLLMPNGIGFSSRFNYQHGTEELDNGDTAPLRHAGPWFGISRLMYAAQRFKAELYAVYNGEVSNDNLAPSEQEKTYMYATDENGNPYSPAWSTLNARLLYRVTDFLMLNVGVENITDKMYRTYSSGIVSAGRNYVLSLRASF
ncbi:TonB-dependent receptor [Olivibacter sp. SDN3]|nr:TonB-dependent receptor [Olivibacter sp. SDN3]